MLPQPKMSIQDNLKQTLSQILETGQITRNDQYKLWDLMSSNAHLSFDEQKGIKKIIDGLHRGVFQIMD
ncbi:MAG: hypothetical protein WBA77_10760 [Microcoleaceae cyanobacterium]